MFFFIMVSSNVLKRKFQFGQGLFQVTEPGNLCQFEWLGLYNTF